MTYRKFAIGLTTVLYLIILAINCVSGYYSKGINSELITISFIAACMVTYGNIVLFRKNRYLVIGLIFSFILLIALAMLTFSQSPKYTYNKAVDIILNDFTASDTVEYMNTEIKTMKSAQSLNYFINKGYIISVVINDRQTSFFFNPINGDYMEIFEP